jgi:hypothetical protein
MIVALYFNTLFAALQLSDDQIDNLTLIEIEKLLQANRKSLTDYTNIPYPKNYVTAELGNRLIYDELNYDAQQQKEEFNGLYKSLTGAFNALHTFQTVITLFIILCSFTKLYCIFFKTVTHY